MDHTQKTWDVSIRAQADSATQLAAKDREIAALREEIVRLEAELSSGPSITQLAALSASPAPDRAESDENMGLAGARAIGEARTSSLRSFSWENRYDFNAPDPAEAMRAKDREMARLKSLLEECAENFEMWHEAKHILAKIYAALKGNGDGK